MLLQSYMAMASLTISPRGRIQRDYYETLMV